MNEHQRIAQYLAPLTANESGAFLLQNDAAALQPPVGKTLVLTTDSVIAGVHLPTDATAEQCVRKCMRRNLSDIAAMGATQWRYLLNLHLPKHTPEAWWVQAAATLASEQAAFDVVLIGGDCTSGADAPHITMTMLGLAERVLPRSGACIDDAIYVSGTIGDAACFYAHASHTAHHASRYYAPTPRLALGAALHGIASSCIDISDGLLQDAAQIAAASGVQCVLQQPLVPLSPETQSMLQQNSAIWRSIISGGDDYELLFTAPADAAPTIARMAQQTRTPITRIGEVRAGTGVVYLNEAGENITPQQLGHSHA